MLELFGKAIGNSRSRGNTAESLAQEYLEEQGLTLVNKNYHCRQGEIDLIMKDQNILVFIEVRYRKTTDYGEAVETVSRAKQQKLIKAASHYLHRYNLTETTESRFDVVGIKPQQPQATSDNQVIFNWIKNAFY